jgi:hypothetical protein
MAETRKWLRHPGNGSDSLAQDISDLDCQYGSLFSRSDRDAAGLTMIISMNATVCGIGTMGRFRRAKIGPGRDGFSHHAHNLVTIEHPCRVLRWQVGG